MRGEVYELAAPETNLLLLNAPMRPSKRAPALISNREPEHLKVGQKKWEFRDRISPSGAKVRQSFRRLLTTLKLVIQIPCYNEEHALASTLALLPRKIPGIKEIEILVIDDGSQDRTSEIARA